MGGEAGLRQARNAHSTLGSHEIVGQFPFHAGYAAWHIVVAKQPTEAFSARNRAIRGADLFSWVDKSIAKALMVPFVVVVPHKLVDCAAKRVLAKEDHAIHACFLVDLAGFRMFKANPAKAMVINNKL